MEKYKFIRYLNGLASKEEVRQVEQWLEKPNAAEELEDLMEASWEAIEPVGDAQKLDQLLEGVHRKINVEVRNKSRKGSLREMWWPVTKVAASIALIGLLAVLVYQQINHPVEQALQEELKVFSRHTGPGQKMKLRLPDQTFVVLNANSTISYQSDFGRKDRKVSLEGEAFFEITPDTQRPFKVMTNDVVTTALGTAFNAYSRNNQVKVALTEGKIKVETSGETNGLNSVVIQPGKMVYSTGTEDLGLNVKDFDARKVTAWKEGRIRFKSKPLKHVVRDLQKWYGINIEINGKINTNRKVSGVFDNESLENILEGLSFSLGIKYEMQENEVIIKK
ncbi:FecR domain-containing protein [Echinicola salinicaeni]|uniref:FecR domain-containing protein n=1 Tax=Echinicola salinicaeni TaxID=2762757 RepID=UPI001645A2EF|nr:FecR domain-containing protein [Echinicola salinicaeni]